MSLALLAFAAAVTQSSSLSVEMTASYWAAAVERSDRIYLSGLRGIADGIEWSNTRLKTNGQKQLYCPPEKLAMTVDQYRSIFVRYVKENPSEGKFPAGLVMLEALVETFPC